MDERLDTEAMDSTFTYRANAATTERKDNNTPIHKVAPSNDAVVPIDTPVRPLQSEVVTNNDAIHKVADCDTPVRPLQSEVVTNNDAVRVDPQAKPPRKYGFVKGVAANPNGRPKGIPNKATQMKEQLEKHGFEPLGELLELYRDPKATINVKADLLKLIIPYCYTKLNHHEHNSTKTTAAYHININADAASALPQHEIVDAITIVDAQST